MRRLALLTALFATVLLAHAEPAVVRRVPPVLAPLELKASGKLDLKLVPECSALWASPVYPGVFWTLSDSGNKPMIVPVRSDGATFPAAKGVTLRGVANVDWEALTGDRAGNMVVGDVGNNVSRRRELAFYFFKEPLPTAVEITDFRKVTFTWPDQTAFPDPELNHDCEAMFLWRGQLYLLTKHRRDTLTDLWRAEIAPGATTAVLTKLARFDAGGMVTDAAISPDGTQLAILTYRLIWVVTLPAAGEDIFHGKMLAAPLTPPLLSWQVEGCSWLDGQTLLLGAEQGDLFRVPLKNLGEVPK